MSKLDATDGPRAGEGHNDLSHLIGSKDEEVRFLPDLSKIADVTGESSCPSCGNELQADIGEPNEPWLKGQRCTKCGWASGSLSKEARRHFTEREKLALIEEDGAATNATKIDVAGTHYENQSADEIAMMIMPLKGL